MRLKIRVLRAEHVRELLPMTECIELMQQTMIAVSAGGAVVPLRTLLRMPGQRGLMGIMPGYFADPECFGLKLISLIPRNKPPEYSSHLGVVLLFEPEHGQPVALLDGAEITAIRTAAASGFATRWLARPEAADLAILGAGEQARSHLTAMLAVRKLRRVRLWARDAAKAAAFAARAFEDHQIRVETCAGVAQAVARADIICTTTKAREPILQGEWLSPGTHLNVVGSSIAGAAEIDTAAVVCARFFVDRRESALNEAGEFLRARQAGAITNEHILAEIGEVAAGTSAGRRTPSDITLYKSLGVAPQDLSAAHYVLKKAEARGVGQVVEL